MRMPKFGTLGTAVVLAVVLAFSGCKSGGQGTTSRPQGGTPQISDRGPGMRRQLLSSLQMLVPRTFELTHVDPKHFAAALGNDPTRIFEFVRDQITYEVYTGYLRGARGTLLAMAGNSVDRAALLASMLQQAGHTVRFARGALPENRARDLVTSMWAERPKPETPQRRTDGNADARAAAQRFVASVNRDFTLITSKLKQARLKDVRLSPGLDQLTAEAQAHYWVQLGQSGTWTDLDPSFEDAALGRAYTQADETLDALPDELSHRVKLSIRVEEIGAGAPSSREVLRFSSKAADLSGADLILVHVPENWQGPAASLAGAMTAAITNSGRVKPILIGGTEPVVGEPFQQTIKTTGIGGVSSILGGEGTRKTTPLAAAEWIEIEFTYPEGRRETIVREIFDFVGKARRSSGQSPTYETIRTKAEAYSSTEGMYSLFFSTGRLDVGHLSNVTSEPLRAEGDAPEIGSLLRRISTLFVAVSDTLLRRVGKPDRAVILFYPDSPRLLITEVSRPAGGPRIGLDLRRDHARAVALGPHPEDVRTARLLRGVVDGTLERVLLEFATTVAREKAAWPAVMGTSSLFEQAEKERIAAILLPAEIARLDPTVPEDALARLREQTAGGDLTIAPQRPVRLAGVPRFAWWRIDPGSGETTAVTDEGLHQEYVLVKEGNSVRVYQQVGPGRYVQIAFFENMALDGATSFIFMLLESGASVLELTVLVCGGKCSKAPR